MAPSTSRRRAVKAAIETRRTQVEPPPQPTSALRLFLVGGILLAGQLGLIARLVQLQIHQAPKLQTQAQQQQRVSLRPQIARRPIADRKGNLLAIDQPIFTLFAHPFLFKVPPEQIAETLAPLLGRSVPDLLQVLGSGESGIPIARELSAVTADKIRALGLDGLDLEQQWQRTYPQRQLTSGIVGYVDADHQGQAGIEYSQQTLLKPNRRSWRLSGDGEGFLLPDLFPLGPINPDELTLRLTLDTRLQRVARTALRQKLQQYRALRGTVIVLDAHTGALLALASEPAFDPQRYYQADPALFRNWAVADLYEPGSTFKPINVAIALEKGAIRASDVLYDQGRIFVGGWPIQNNDFAYVGGRGPLTITQIMEYSSNVGMVHMMERLKPADYFEYLQRLGIGEAVGSDLPFETAGQFKDKDQFVTYPIEPATTAFGQGFSVTPLQMAQLHGAIANGGKRVTPHVIDGLYDRAGKRVKAAELPPTQQVFSASTAKQVQQMMGSVVARGTGKPAQIPGYRLGGKTGTAQKASGGTYINARITSFVALFPLESPRYVVLAVVDEPKGDDAFGSTVAAPIVKTTLEALITLEGIPPSHPGELPQSQQPKN